MTQKIWDLPVVQNPGIEPGTVTVGEYSDLPPCQSCGHPLTLHRFGHQDGPCMAGHHVSAEEDKVDPRPDACPCLHYVPPAREPRPVAVGTGLWGFWGADDYLHTRACWVMQADGNVWTFPSRAIALAARHYWSNWDELECCEIGEDGEPIKEPDMAASTQTYTDPRGLPLTRGMLQQAMGQAGGDDLANRLGLPTEEETE